MPKSRNNKNTPFIILSILFVSLALLIVGYFICGEIFLPRENEPMKGNRIRFENKWNVISPEGFDEPIELSYTFDVKPGEEIILESVLPEQEYDGLAMMTWCPVNTMRIYIDGELRMNFDSSESRMFGIGNCASYKFIDLNDEDSGKPIRLESIGFDRSSGKISSIFMEEKSELMKYIFYDNRSELFGGLFVIIISVICLIASYFLTIIMKQHIRMAFLSWGVFFTAIWILFNSPIRIFLFPNQSVVNDVIFFSVGVLGLPYALYLNDLQNFRNNKLYTICCSISLTMLVTAIVIYTTCPIVITKVYPLLAGASIICMISMVVSIIIDTIKRKIKEYRYTAIGIFIVSLCGLLEVAIYILKIKWLSDGTVLLFGLIFLLTFSIIDTIKDFIHANEEKDEAIKAQLEQARFLANMSHEIRTPINAILGMNEIILRKEKNSEIASYAMDIKSAGDSLLSLVNDVLDYSKIESGKLDIIPVDYDVKGLVTAVGNIILGKAEEKGLSLNVNIDPTIPETLNGDEIRIRQIAINLLSNAVKYTSEGNVRFSVGYIKTPNEETGIEDFILKIIVADTGIGIKEEDKDKLFDSFRRVDMKKNRSVQGTGLGLAITRQLIELMNGKITVKSEYGFGSTFTVLLPQAVASQTSVGSYSFGQSLKNQTPEIFSHIIKAHDARILVVDDVSMNLRVFSKLLEGTGISIDTATSGKEALARCNVKKYRIIFLDHMMPEMDGIETFMRLKENTSSPNIDTPVIMLTANALSTAESEYLEAGFTDYLSKPVSLKALEEMILKYLPEECL